jgi:hypothetical protein
MQRSASHRLLPLPGRANVDAHADAVARIVRHLGHVFLAVVTVQDPVPVDTLFAVLPVARFATLDRICDALDVVAVSVTGCVVADCSANQRAGNCCRVIAASAADLVTDDAANDGTNEGPCTPFLPTAVDRVVPSLLPALADRRRNGNVIDDRLGRDDLRVVVLRARCGPSAQAVVPNSIAARARVAIRVFAFMILSFSLFTGHLPACGQD